MFHWHVENTVWEVDTKFWPEPLEVTDEEDGRTRKIHPKPEDKFSLQFSNGDPGGGEALAWNVDNGTGEVELRDDSKWSVERIGDRTSTRWKVIAELS